MAFTSNGIWTPTLCLFLLIHMLVIVPLLCLKTAVWKKQQPGWVSHWASSLFHCATLLIPLSMFSFSKKLKLQCSSKVFQQWAKLVVSWQSILFCFLSLFDEKIKLKTHVICGVLKYEWMSLSTPAFGWTLLEKHCVLHLDEVYYFSHFAVTLHKGTIKSIITTFSNSLSAALHLCKSFYCFSPLQSLFNNKTRTTSRKKKQKKLPVISSHLDLLSIPCRSSCLPHILSTLLHCHEPTAASQL